MLNDLLTIERELRARGVPLVDKHPDVKEMAKGFALRVRLDARGTIADVDLVEEAGNGRIWTLRDGQHNGFPGLKTAAGLLHLEASAQQAHKERWKAAGSPGVRRQELRHLLDTFPFRATPAATWPSAGHRRRIGERLAALGPLAADRKAAAVPAAFERFLLAIEADPPFLQDLHIRLASYVDSRGDEWLEPIQAALVGPVPLAIDVDVDAFERDATDRRQVAAVSAALGDTVEAARTGACSMTGEHVALHAGTFPQPNLPGIGQTYLFSRNPDIPSLTRYGRSADGSLAVGAHVVRRMAGAIHKLTEPAAEGRTWRLIPAEAGNGADLMTVSFREMEEPLADALAQDEDDDATAFAEARLLELASRVVEQSKGSLRTAHAQNQMTVLVLRTVDPANRKVIYRRSTTPEAFRAAAVRWSKAVRNTPDWAGFPVRLAGEPKPVFRRPHRIAPLSITPLTRTLFADGGRRRIDVSGAPAADAFTLFLDEPSPAAKARQLLRLVLRRHGALHGGLVQAARKGIDRLKDFDPKADLRRHALRSATLVGALLHYLGRPREDYMSDAAFKLGQLLHAADMVHVGYCADVRGGDIPPTLIGNAVFAIAGTNPTRALAILQGRWKPYGAWARQSDRIKRKSDALIEKHNSNTAWQMRHGLRNARRLPSLIKDMKDLLESGDTRLTKPDDRFRAELLLGYMAGLELSKTGVASDGDETSADDASTKREDSE